MQPTLTQGNMIATPTAATTPAQTQTAIGAGWTPTTTLDANSLNNTQPVGIPTTGYIPPTTTVPSPTGTTTDANGMATITSNPDDVMKNMLGLTNEIGTEGTVKSGLETSLGTDAKLAQATSDYNAYNKAKNDQTNQLEQMRTSSGGLEGSSNSEMLAYQKATDAQISNLAYTAQVSQGLYDSAEKTLNDKLDTQFKPLQDKLDNLSKIYPDLVKPMQDALADVNKTANDLNTQFVQNQAPVSVVSAVDKVVNDYVAGKISAADAKAQMIAAAGKYGVDKKITSDIAYQQSEINKNNILAAQSNGSDTVSILDGNNNPISVPIGVVPYINTSHSGINFIDGSTLEGTATEKKDLVDQATNAGLKVIVNKNSVLDLTNIKDANSKLDTINTFFADIAQPDALARDLGGAGLTQLGILAQTDPKAAVSQSVGIIGLDILKAISGVQGFRGNQTAIQQVQDHLPKATDTIDVVNGKIEFIQKLMNDRENAILGQKGSNAPITYLKSPDGKSQVDSSKLTPAQLKEAQTAGWK